MGGRGRGGGGGGGRGGAGGSGGRKMNYKEKSGISFIQQEEPDFIKKMKAQMGYKEPAKLEDKFEDREDDEADDADEFGENGPQVVVLDPSKDLSQEELDQELAERKKVEDEKMIAEGKIQFRKPAKRAQEGDAKEETETVEKKKKPEEKPKVTVNKTLLSFGDDEEEDE